MKSLATKLFAIIFVIILAAGCASSITAPQEIQDDNTVQVDAPKPDGDDITSGGDMEGHREKPDPWD